MNQATFTIVRFGSGRERYGFEHPFDVAKSINELFSRGELLLAPTAAYNVLLYFINLRFRKVAQNVLIQGVLGHVPHVGLIGSCGESMRSDGPCRARGPDGKASRASTTTQAD
jgi:hypothetical protein